VPGRAGPWFAVLPGASPRHAGGPSGRGEPGRARHYRRCAPLIRETDAPGLTGEGDKGVAAVAAQVANVRLRALELERRHRETDELEAQVAELERRIFGDSS
jgi:hypothetical protein